MVEDVKAAPSVEELEHEGDVAADFIEELLDIADIDGDLNLDVRQGRAYVSVEAEGDGLAVLSAPDTVQALQELTRLAVQNQTGTFSRMILDIGGSRDTRRRQLEQLVDAAVAKLDEGATQASLPSMSSYERKLVHDIVSDRGLTSESYGEGADRHVPDPAAGRRDRHSGTRVSSAALPPTAGGRPASARRPGCARGTRDSRCSCPTAARRPRASDPVPAGVPPPGVRNRPNEPWSCFLPPSPSRLQPDPLTWLSGAGSIFEGKAAHRGGRGGSQFGLPVIARRLRRRRG